MMSDPSIVLIAGTRNRPCDLERLLASVADQTYQASRVIIIDQSDAPVRAENARVIAALPASLRVDHVVADRPGLSAARNAGLRLAEEDIVGFPDDDCWYAPDVLSRVVGKLQPPDVSFVCGTYGDPSAVSDRASARARPLTPLTVLRHCNSVSLFFKAGAIRSRCLTFDERIGAGTEYPAGEETDFVLRALQHELCGRWEPSLVVYHAESRPANLSADQSVARTRAFAYTVTRNVMRGQLIIGVPAASFLLKWSIRALFSGYARRRVVGFWRGARRAMLDAAIPAWETGNLPSSRR